MQELGEEFGEDLKHATVPRREAGAPGMSFNLFENEEAAIARGRALVEAGGPTAEALRGGLFRAAQGFREAVQDDAPPGACLRPQRGGAQRNGREAAAGGRGTGEEEPGAGGIVEQAVEISFAAGLQLDLHRRAGGEAGEPAQEAHGILLRHRRFHRDDRQDGIGGSDRSAQPVLDRDVQGGARPRSDDRQI